VLNRIARVLVISISLWLFIRIFLFQTFIVPTNSMNCTLLEGDYILVNKLAYGARIPITPLSLSLSNKSIFLDWIQLPYWRIPGYSAVKRNDVIVFNFPLDDKLPVDERQKYVKRCIGLPGDTLSIRNAEVFINKNKLPETENVLYNYTVSTNGNSLDKTITNQFDAYMSQNTFTNNFTFFLSTKNADSIAHLKTISSVKKNSIPENSYSPAVFPNSSEIKWNIDNFGSLYIPKKGEQITLTAQNLIIYKRVIEMDEHNQLKVKNDSVFINNVYTRNYTFKMNYYFTLGDNRYNSIDSRYWGFVPENHLIGKASCILHSSKEIPFQNQKQSRSFSFIK